MEKGRTSSLVLRSSIIAALGGLLFGFDTAVISGTTDALQSVFSLTDGQLGFTVSSALIGTILGAATIQFPSNKIGRKWTLVLIAALYFISAIGSAFPGPITDDPAQNHRFTWYSFMFFRFLGGIGVGGASVVSPMYTAEIAPPKKRGVLVALTQFNIVFGILVAYVSNFIIAGCHLGATEWRWMFGVEAVPAFFFMLALFINPESPRWLISVGRREKGRALLSKLVGSEEEAEEEFQAIDASLAAARSKTAVERFFCSRYRKPIMLAICIAAFNQLSGINAILYYAPKVFRIAGASESMAMFFPTIIGLTNFIFTMLALFFIDRFGRKTLMYAGSFGYILSLAAVGTAFTVYHDQFEQSIKSLDAQAAAVSVENPAKEVKVVKPLSREGVEEMASEAAKATAAEVDATIAAATLEVGAAEPKVETPAKSAVPMIGVVGVLIGLMVFIAAHAFGQGAVIWVFISEIFPTSIRAQGQALGSFTHWILAALVSGFFPPMLGALGPSAVFFVFCGMMCLQLLWVIFFMPETKGVPLEDMQKKLGIE